jgi:hypothetical protein
MTEQLCASPVIPCFLEKDKRLERANGRVSRVSSLFCLKMFDKKDLLVLLYQRRW